MNAAFPSVSITGLLNERCYAVEGSALRIYLSLSQYPPLGWSYVFSQVWSAVDYPGKRPVGIDDGALWIECAPEDVRTCHLPHLEAAITHTNARYRAQREQSEIALEHQRELSRQTHAKLDALARSFVPEPCFNTTHSVASSRPASRLDRILDFIRRWFCAKQSKSA